MLKVGIFGVGHLGEIHLKQWKEIPGVELIGFVDPDNNRANEIAQIYEIKEFTKAEDLILACDVLDIVTPTTSHFEVAKLCLRHSRHIFIEKPIAQTVDEAKSIVKMVGEANVKCQVGHVERYNPAVLALGQYHIEPMFVEAHRLAEFNPRGTDVAVVLDLMIHDIDALLHFVSSPVKKIAASGVAVVSDTTDIANAHIEFDNGCVANLTASRISLKKMRKMRLFQQDAYIGIDFFKKNVEIIRMKNKEDRPGFLDVPIELANGNKKIISIEHPHIPDVNAIREELAAFILSIYTDKPVAVSAIDGLNALEIAHQIMNKIERQTFPHPIVE